jgi:hypothetical protein
MNSRATNTGDRECHTSDEQEHKAIPLTATYPATPLEATAAIGQPSGGHEDAANEAAVLSVDERELLRLLRSGHDYMFMHYLETLSPDNCVDIHSCSAVPKAVLTLLQLLLHLEVRSTYDTFAFTSTILIIVNSSRSSSMTLGYPVQ